CERAVKAEGRVWGCAILRIVTALLPRVIQPDDREALRAGGVTLTYRELHASASSLASDLVGASRVAVWATPTLETCVAVVGALLAGVAAVPVNPKMGSRELDHVVSDSAPSMVVAAADA